MATHENLAGAPGRASLLLCQLLIAAAVIPRPVAAQTAPYQEPGRLGDPASWRTPEFAREWGLGA
ncbi:hypothetical protein, partial [Burkholderia ambifaria]|uniref:hypothetical protein n=1 Tax=Burkholderia ambifaria TaxID=152480 RepID=UPI00158A4E8E